MLLCEKLLVLKTHHKRLCLLIILAMMTFQHFFKTWFESFKTCLVKYEISTDPEKYLDPKKMYFVRYKSTTKIYNHNKH